MSGILDSGEVAVAVMGAGAVGCYFGGMLARSGVPVTLIGRAARVEAIAAGGLEVDGVRIRETIRLAATTDPAAARGASIVLLSVKTPDTEDAIRALLPHLVPAAVIVSLQNGVDNVPKIRALARNPAIPAVVYVAAELTGPGRLRHTGRGDLVIGNLRDPSSRPSDPAVDLGGLAALFERALVPCRISADIEGELWTKLIMNCAYNAISALCGAKYGLIAGHPSSRDLMEAVVGEALAVAAAAEVKPAGADPVDAARKLGLGMGEAVSSTAQDLARGRPTEIDSLNGYLVRRGAELGVATPVNRTLHALVKVAEAARRP